MVLLLGKLQIDYNLASNRRGVKPTARTGGEATGAMPDGRWVWGKNEGESWNIFCLPSWKNHVRQL